MDPTSPQDCIDGLSSAEKAQHHKHYLVFTSQRTPLLSDSVGVDTPTWLECPVICCVERHVGHSLVKPTADDPTALRGRHSPVSLVTPVRDRRV
jgi:hypothetical protein